MNGMPGGWISTLRLMLSLLRDHLTFSQHLSWLLSKTPYLWVDSTCRLSKPSGWFQLFSENSQCRQTSQGFESKSRICVVHALLECGWSTMFPEKEPGKTWELLKSILENISKLQRERQSRMLLDSDQACPRLAFPPGSADLFESTAQASVDLGVDFASPGPNGPYLS